MQIDYFGDFVKADSTLQRVDTINRFQLVAEVPKISAWSDSQIKARIQDRIYDRLRSVTREAKFFHEWELSPRIRGDEVGVIYDDDIFDFAVTCEDGRMVVDRRGSSMEAFVRWYFAFMPSAGSVMNDTLSAITTLTDRKLGFNRVSYRFNFVIYDIQPEHEARVLKNIEVMHKLMRGFPDDDGHITSNNAPVQYVSRADFAVTRWVGSDNARRLVRYSVEAPANRNWSSLWFGFSYGSESFTDPATGVRSDLEPESVFSEWEAALTGFLRERALKGFLGSLMKDYRYRCASGGLP